MQRVSLFDEAGEFCTERAHPALPKLRAALESGSELLIERDRVKLLTTSFIDELLSELAKEFSIESVRKQIQFSPELEEFYWMQVERGVRLRSPQA